MSNLKHYEHLVNELVSSQVTEKRMMEIRDELINIVFSFGEGSVFDYLVRWDLFVKMRVEHNKSNLEIPGNKESVIDIVNKIRSLDYLNKKN